MNEGGPLSSSTSDGPGPGEGGPLSPTRETHLSDDETVRPDQLVFPSSTSDVSTPDIKYHVRLANVRAGLDPDAYLDIEPTCAEAEWANDKFC